MAALGGGDYCRTDDLFNSLACAHTPRKSQTPVARQAISRMTSSTIPGEPPSAGSCCRWQTSARQCVCMRRLGSCILVHCP
eukprot:14115618-Alexandrium_andersonii.AAC.1